jgi:large subunit ribosomal protein L9
MKIILTESIERIGKAGQIINVKDGFARNYLLPKKLAIIATAANLKKISEIESEAQDKINRKILEFRQLADKVKSLEATFSRRADEEGKLFGSVSEVDILAFLTENDVHCVKSQIVMESHLKHIGEFEVKIAFTHDIDANLKVKVEAE